MVSERFVGHEIHLSIELDDLALQIFVVCCDLVIGVVANRTPSDIEVVVG